MKRNKDDNDFRDLKKLVHDDNPSKIEAVGRSPNIKDLSSELTAKEFCIRCDAIEKFICSNKQLRKNYRILSNEEFKRFAEEALPIKKLLDANYYNVKSVMLHLDDGLYDSTIKCQDGKKRIQITCAKNGHQNFLRNKELNDKGEVNGLVPITFSGTKNTGHKVDIPDIAVWREDTINNALRLIEKTLLKKKQKKYPSETILLVSFDDGSIKGEDTLKSGVLTLITNLKENPFSDIIIQGTTGKIYYPI